MTTSRIIRGTKAKVFLYVCGILAVTALIACYNNALTQLDEVKKSNDICHQQQENLSTQLQVISEYKQKLEKSLKNEQAEHQQSKNNLEVKTNELSQNEKLTSDALLKYKSLQQHYKLLQTEHDDFKEESSNTQKKSLEEINSLQLKLKEVEEELKKVKASRENIKTQIVEMEIENTQLKKEVQSASQNESQLAMKFMTEEYRILKDKYASLREKCGEKPEEPLNKPSEKAIQNLPAFKLAENPSSSTKAVEKISPSRGSLNGARPLHVPSVTPETLKKEVNLKLPQGVVVPPENQNEQPQVQFENRNDKVDDADKENVAQEVFDNNIEGLGFADEGPKEKLNLQAKIPDKKKHVDANYHQQEEDDDLDDYGVRPGRGEEIAVRN